MSKKSELIKLFNEFKDRYNSIQSRITEVNKSYAYTPVGKEQALKRIMEEFSPTVQLYHDKSIESIDNGLAALLEKWRTNSTGRLSDIGYQMGLANTLKIIEADAIHDIEDMKNIINTYKNDYNAMATIKNILSKSTKALNFVGIIPRDNRDYNKKLLEELRNNVEVHINPTMAGAGFNTGDSFIGTSSVSMAMDSMADFVNTRLGDDLSLIQ
jgi:hypothetical protein